MRSLKVQVTANKSYSITLLLWTQKAQLITHTFNYHTQYCIQ